MFSELFLASGKESWSTQCVSSFLNPLTSKGMVVASFILAVINSNVLTSVNQYNCFQCISYCSDLHRLWPTPTSVEQTLNDNTMQPVCLWACSDENIVLCFYSTYINTPLCSCCSFLELRLIHKSPLKTRCILILCDTSVTLVLFTIPSLMLSNLQDWSDLCRCRLCNMA